MVRREDERAGTSVERLIAAYEPAFRRTMLVAPEEAGSSEALARALAGLSEPARALAEGLLIGVGAGEVLLPRYVPVVDAHGEELWRMAFLLPRTAPSHGATIDPRHYAAGCRINPALTPLRPLSDLRAPDDAYAAHGPPSDALWDATVVAALLESNPAPIKTDGRVRKDVISRLLSRLGKDEDRWMLALSLGRATGLVREAAGRLYGRPESHPRRLPLLEPTALLEGELALAGAALMRVVDHRWLPLDALINALERRCPDLLVAERDQPWAAREAGWFRTAAAALHRAGVLDASLGPQGVVAVRLASPRPQRSYGFFLTPDRDILVAPGELPGAEYGRLCRLAPYVDGDVVHRHRLSREGVVADIAAGYEDLLPWLATRSRTGLPPMVRDVVQQWAASAVRVTLLTGVTVLEEDGKLTAHQGRLPSQARLIYYDEVASARFTYKDGVLSVPYGEDALTVRAVMSRLGEPLPPDERAHRWQLRVRPTAEPDRVLDQLRRYHDGPLPAELEARLHAAGGRTRCWSEAAVVLHLPPEAAEALRRDSVLGPHLRRDLGDGQVIVDERVLPQVEARLRALGYDVEDPPPIPEP